MADTFSISTVYHARTPKALLIKDLAAGDVWIPFSQIIEADFDDIEDLVEGEAIEITIPLWLAREKGLVE